MRNYILNRWINRPYKIGGIKLLLTATLSAATLSVSLTSCVADNEANSKSIADINDANIKSYGDLFQVFWNVMNQRYCDLNEQPDVASLNWDEVYSTYKPKFDALKSFQHTSDYTQAEILADNALAKQYFKEIMSQILDQHFFVKITLPISHSSTETVRFGSTLHKKTEYFPLNYHWNYTANQLDPDRAFGDGTDEGFCIMGGFLKDNPDTYYLGFNQFALYENCFHTYKKEYLPTNNGNPYHLEGTEIDLQAQKLVTNPQNLSPVELEAEELLARINNYLASEDVEKACTKMAAYSNQGDYYGLYAHANNAYQQAPSLLKNLPTSESNDGISSQLKELLSQETACKTINKESQFKNWFCQAIANYLWHEREFNAFWSDLRFTVQHSFIEGYRSQFLEPLAKGNIKKLILDFRGNGGGSVIDTRLLTDYLVSHSTTFCYIRKKEDNNPYSYTPWVPQRIAITESSLKRDIPTAILLDNYSASMSEMTTLILKSQGDHVKTVGRNSYGAQSMLTDNNDASNGGWVGNVTRYLYFYMPTCLTKDAQGNLLEGKGITPDYILDPMTQDEIISIMQNETNAIDRGMQKALEILK